MTGRIGKEQGDIFSKTTHKKGPPLLKTTEENTEPVPVSKARGRPQMHQDDWEKVTVVLLRKQIHWLDSLAADIRFNNKSAFSRSELLRAMIEAVKESGLDLHNVTNEEELKNLLLGLLK
jgi:hypothetical protein